MADDDSEKTEAATPRRKQEAREEGNIVRSQDLTAAATLLGTVVLLNIFGMHMLSSMKVSVETLLRTELGTNPTRADDIVGMFAYGLRLAVAGAAPLLLSIAGITLLAAVSQVGFIITGKPLVPQFSRLSPLSGLKKLFDARAGVRLIMSLAKVGVIASVAGWVIYDDLPQILILTELEVAPLFSASCGLVYALALKLALLLVCLALLDYGFQFWQHGKDLRMSKQEIKEEMKRMEGDPLIKQRRARVARQLAMQRVGQAVPQADVIVTNPTHFAVALKYDSKTMRAPKVVAKGADFLAMHIRQLAAVHGVPIIERKELARALFANVEPGQEVPAEFYNAVAEILAYVYRIGGRKSA